MEELKKKPRNIHLFWAEKVWKSNFLPPPPSIYHGSFRYNYVHFHVNCHQMHSHLHDSLFAYNICSVSMRKLCIMMCVLNTGVHPPSPLPSPHLTWGPISWAVGARTSWYSFYVLPGDRPIIFEGRNPGNHSNMSGKLGYWISSIALRNGDTSNEVLRFGRVKY